MSLRSFPLAIYSSYFKFLRICELLEKFAEDMPNSCRLETQKFVLNCEIQRADKWLDDTSLNHLIANMVRLSVMLFHQKVLP